ncbi:glutathione S-transferase family protein [Photobacterium rosenbergii]|uniref:Glutathione S-transferase family protein n=1 Tax=Photobacterium rosenbergii TaxID=294936 RepID=A0A2T3NDE4_9GAMM|nr:glutathione S-transferase family protein [Photobacterium rosenbergii]PSW12212.1 glutathione S-transferase family protein [Photobacterium rosenbergii]
MNKPVFFHDPTSEPSRAVHWLCLEADLPVDIRLTWLTRGQHVSPEFMQVNPFHQVPALQHDDFCLSEATAMMNYLTDINGCSDNWFGGDIKTKALINKHLSWYHTNLRRLLTLDYFLPVLLMPVYLGFAKPSDADIAQRKEAMDGMFKQLDSLLVEGPFLCGDQITAADILYASEIVSLKIDPDYASYIARYPHMARWLEILQSRPAYQDSHKAWDHVYPMILAAGGEQQGSPDWVAAACEQVL